MSKRAAQPRRAADRRQADRRRRSQWLTLAAILLLATLLRFWQLGDLPPGLYHDEAYNGLDALALTQGQTFPNFYEGWELYAADAHANRPPAETRFPIFFEGNYGREPLHIYLMALSIKLFGAGPFALRAVPAAAGVLAVFTTFLAAQALVHNRPGTQRVPYLAAFLLAILYPALTFSRFGLRVMLFLPLETLTIYCFWQAINRAQNDPGRGRLSPLAWFILAGVGLGLGIYTYAAARLLPLLFILFIPLWFWRVPAARPLWRAVAAMAAAALLTAAPLLIFFARYPYFFIFRTGYVANKGLGTFPDRPWLTWLNNIGRVIRGLFWYGETHLRHNLPGRAYLDPLQASFFLLGLGHLWSQRHSSQGWRWRSLFLLLWLGVMLLPTLLSGDAPHFGRMAGIAPVVAILAALGANWLWDWLAARPGRVAPLAPWLILTALALSASLAVYDYFIRYANHPDLPAAFYQDDWQLGLAAAAEPASTTLYLTPTQEEMATIYFALNGDTARLADFYGPGGVVPAGLPNQPILYYVRPADTTTLARLQDFFPTGQAEAAQFGVIPFRVPAEAPRLPGRNPTDVAFSSPAGETIALVDWVGLREADQLYVTLYWQAVSPLTANYTAYVHLLDEAGRLATQLDRPPAGFPTSDWRRGELVADQFTLLLTGLPAGSYTLQTGFYRVTGDTLIPLGQPATLGTIAWDGG